MDINEIIETLGEKTVLEAILKWLPQDTIDSITEDLIKDYDLDI